MQRSRIIEEKVLLKINRLRIETLIMDWSGILKVEAKVLHHLLRIIEGGNLMGCKSVLTGLRPEIVRNITRLGLTFENKAETKATLRQALEDYMPFSQ
ncbi:STAS domain-containing protein [Peribacillus sp. SCS-155]|uniref:STAS domain-containing protein n=1 Tax=Peribacillus sedimenti TaxID=3115297 RepID=UPI0039067C67